METTTFNMKNCTLCPRRCGADRRKRPGLCGGGEKMKVARAALHFYEEPCISGKEGSGTVFFSGCPLGCVFCQNGQISRRHEGREIEGEDLVRIAFSLKKQGANNLNLVTPCHFAPQIRDALLPVKEALALPVAINTGSYDTLLQLSFFEGLADIYMPDFKFLNPETAAHCAKAPDYPEICLAAIGEMLRQVGAPQYDDRGMLRRGVIVRHLVLPGRRRESMEILRTIKERFGSERLLLSLMSQYAPMEGVPKDLDRRVTTFEYESVKEVAEELGFKGYFQHRSSASKDYIPAFDLTGVTGF